MTQSTTPHWTKEFDEKFVEKIQVSEDEFDVGFKGNIQDLHDFIKHLLAESISGEKKAWKEWIDNSKIISSVGYIPSKFRGLSAVAIYNLALEDLLTKESK